MAKSGGGESTPSKELASSKSTPSNGESAGGLAQILRQRRDKAERLAELGWPSFPNGLEVKNSVRDVREAAGDAPETPSDTDPLYRLGGRIGAVRGMGKAMFLDLWDRTGRL